MGASAYHCEYTHITAPANTAIVTHTQVRERTSRHPPRNPARSDSGARSSPRGRGRTRASRTALSTNVAASNTNASPAPTPSTSAVASTGTEQERHVRRRFGQRSGVLDQRLGNGLREQAAVSGLEERLRGAEQRLDHDDLPYPGRAREYQHRECRVQQRTDRVGRDHDPMARNAVRPHAADEQQRD